MSVYTALLGAALYAVHPIAVPTGMSIAIAPTPYQGLWEPSAFRRPTSVTLSRDGTVAVIVRPNGGGADRVLVIAPHASGAILPPIPDALIARRIGSYAVSREGRGTSGSGRLQNVIVADDGRVIVSFAFAFSGGYGGLDEATFVWFRRAWRDVLPSDLPGSAVNVWVAGASRSSIALVKDFLDQSPFSMRTEEASGVNLQSAVLMFRDGAIKEIGHGIATDEAGAFVSGYDAGFRPSPQGAFYSEMTKALLWTAKGAHMLGPGISWAVNTNGESAGDDRWRTGVAGRPVCWCRDGMLVLSRQHGSGFAIDDHGVIVGSVREGGFIAVTSHKRTSARLLDSLLQDRRWHVSAAYRISAHGLILALGSRAGANASLLVLEPLRS